MNYFELFEIVAAPVVNTTGLAKKYFELQKKYHPDFATNATAEEQNIILAKASDINKAFTVFKNADATLEYFLQLKAAITPDEKYELPQDFLFEVMELNEMFSGDTGEIDAFTQKISAEVQDVLVTYDIKNSWDTDELNRLKAYYYKKKYLSRILDRFSD